MDELTLKLEHLSTYLPHKVQFISELDKPYEEYGKQPIWTLNGLHEIFGDYSLLTKENEDSYAITKCKLILRPLSINLLTDIFPFADDLEEVLLAIEEDNIEYIRHDLFTEIVKNHGDVYGLIHRGLAVKIREMNDEN